MIKTFKAGCALVALPMILVAQPAMAGQATGQMPVSAQVLENCSVVSSAMNFGPITDVGAANVDTTATLTLACTANASYEIQLDNGANPVAGQRRLANAAKSEFLNYDIYKDISRSSRWGSTIGADTVAGKATVLGTASVTAYGRIPSGVAKVSAGAYTDTVTVTVNF
ncbi:MAG: spore coat protein U domain-containing protein [Erythrobacter sp.]|jgi:spore coat protein U-like protein|nr:spore coat protein U domain-containing protein [Erythrobacter sp.]